MGPLASHRTDGQTKAQREGGTGPVQGHRAWRRRTQTSSSQSRGHASFFLGRPCWARVWPGTPAPFPVTLTPHVFFFLPQFLLIFRKAAAGELQEDSGLHVLARLSEIDVSTEGVKGAKSFFEAKVRNERMCGAQGEVP